MKKEIRILIDNKEIEYYELDDYLKNINCIYKEDGKWLIEYKEEDKKIEKIDYDFLQSFEDEEDMRKYDSMQIVFDKINEIIDYINKENK